MGRIALFMPDFAGGGAERFMLWLAGRLAERGAEVELLTAWPEGPLASLVPNHVRTARVGGRPGAVVRDLALRLRRGRYAALLSTVAGANLAAAAAALLSGRSAMVVLREASVARDMHRTWRRAAARLLYPRADRVVAVSGPVAEDVVGAHGVNADRVSTIPNPVDAALLQASVAAGRPPPRTGGTSLVVAAGRLVPTKRFEDVLRAVNAAGLRDTRVALLGSGPERGRLVRLGRALLGSERLSMPGWVANPYPWYAVASVVVSTSRWEGCPNVVLEAVALGTPVVAYERRDTRWLRDLGVPLRLVPDGDWRSLGKAIAEVVAEGTRPVPHLPRCFDPDVVADRYTQVLCGER